jgi:nucleoside-diphosphate-sugar epimerase
MILVTGGTGLLGSHLLYELTRSGKKIRAVKRETSDTGMTRKIFSYYTAGPDILLNRIQWIDADLLDPGAIEDALDGIEEVYHCGAIVSFFPRDHKAMLAVNIKGTENLVNQSIDKGIRKFCFVSSVSTLGRADHPGLIDEQTHWIPSRKNSVYSVSKYGAEREVWRGMEEGLNAVIIQPSVILGPGFWKGNSGLFRLVWNGLRFYTRGVNGYVDVFDTVRSMTGVMEKELFGKRFIVSSENLTYEELFTLIARHLEKPAPSIHVPPFLSGIAWRVEAIRSFLTGSLPEVTKEMAYTASQKYFYSSEYIRETLGFEFRPVEESIRGICELFRKDVAGDR